MWGQVKGIILEITKNGKGKLMQNGATEKGMLRNTKYAFWLQIVALKEGRKILN